tara:strand:- start:67 stop:1689 length:1623 start_codon:yes stop_codon:yes gene_type:complete
MDPLKFLKKKSKLVLDKSMKAYDYVKGKVKAGYTYLVDKKARWRKYYNEIKSYFSPRFLVDAITPSDILDTVKKVTKKKDEEQVFKFVLGCSLVTGCLVGIPGDIGVGLLVAQAVEFAMAVQIARLVGLNFSEDNVFKLLGAAGITTAAILIFFEKVLHVIFKFIAQLPIAAPASFVSTSVTTMFLGMFCYLSFFEIKKSNKKSLSVMTIMRICKNAYKFTYKISKSMMSLLFKDMPGLFKQIKENVKLWMKADLDFKKKIKGEIFFAGSMAYLLEGKNEKLNGPLSEMWLDAWRMSYTDKLGSEATVDQIREIAESYSNDQMPYVENLVQSKFYEILESTHENMDGDKWSAKLFEDPAHPGTDVRFYNSETKQTYEVNYKLTDDTNYIEHHLEKYPDKPVITSPEVAEKMNNPLVSGGKYHPDEVIKLSDKNFDALLSSEHDLYLQEGAATAGIIVLSLHLFPFFVAYSKGRINKNQFETAVKKFVPEITTKTLNRIIMLTLMGPIFGWFLLASFILKVSTHESDNTKKIKQLIYKPLV